MLLKLPRPHPGFVMNVVYSYNFFVDKWVSFRDGLAHRYVFVAQTRHRAGVPKHFRNN